MSDRPRGRIEWLYDEYAAGLYRYALMILADPAGAADAVHQVFLRLIVGPTFRSGDRIDVTAGYLKRAVRNECFSALRLRTRGIVELRDTALLEKAPDASEGPDDRLSLEQALRTLPPDQREVVHLKIFEGLTFQEIADLADESINTIASRYRYAIEKLRKVIN